MRKALACGDPVLPHDGGRGDRHVRRMWRAGREDRRLAEGAGGFVVDGSRERLARCADRGDAVGVAVGDRAVVRACGQPEQDGQGQQQQPKQTPGTHRTKGGREDRRVQGLRTGPSVGSMNQKLDPRPGIDSAPMVPPCISTNFLQRASPSPVPWAWRLAEVSTWLNS